MIREEGHTTIDLRPQPEVPESYDFVLTESDKKVAEKIRENIPKARLHEEY